MQQVVASGRSLLKNWDTPKDLQKARDVYLQKAAMAPKKTTAADATAEGKKRAAERLQQVERERAQAAEDASKARAAERLQKAEREREEAAAQARLKQQQKEENAKAAALAFRAMKEEAGQTPVKTEPGEKLPTPGNAEFARMLSNLKGDKTPHGVEQLQKFRLCTTQQEKRQFYWGNWVVSHPANQAQKAAKTHSSSKRDRNKVKDFGWVEREFVAKRKCLQDWAFNESQEARLEHYLQACASKQHPADPKLRLYHYTEEVDEVEQENEELLKFENGTDLTADEYEQAVAGLTNGASSSTGAAQAPKRKLAKALPAPLEADEKRRNKLAKPADPEWMVAFRKSALAPFNNAKNSCETVIRDCREILLDADTTKGVKTQLLAKAYKEEVEKALAVLCKAVEAAGTWKRSVGETPASEADAASRAAVFETRVGELKRHKSAFKTACDTKLKELKAMCEAAKAPKA